MGQYLDATKPALAEYLALVQKIKNTVQERKALLVEKKETHFWNAPKHKELNAKIAELTEDIEEPKSEKFVLMDHLNCTDDTEISVIKKDITAGLFKLEQQEEKYSSELEAALSEYAALKEQGADFDSTELYGRRMVLRPEKTADAAQRIQSAYGEKYEPLVMFDSQQDVDELLHEDAEERAYQREREQQKQQERKEKNHRTDYVR